MTTTTTTARRRATGALLAGAALIATAALASPAALGPASASTGPTLRQKKQVTRLLAFDGLPARKAVIAGFDRQASDPTP
jgi:hypothetical protein